MKVSELSPHGIADLLAHGDLLVKLGPFVARIKSDVSTLAADLASIYDDFQVQPPGTFADFHVEVRRERGLRRWIKPQVRFFFDGRPSFIPLPATQAFPMLEWGLNWCVAAHCHQYLIFHAAVIEKGGLAVLMPAPPGSGKSTLCTGLVMRGWRLLSDELALYDMDSGLVHGMSRPINLKNESIAVIRKFAPQAVMTKPVADTTKGTVALMRPPAESVARVDEPAHPAWIVLPKYVAESKPEMRPYSKARTAMLLAEQSFNYDLQGLCGFNAIGDLVSKCECLQFTYNSLDDAERAFERLNKGHKE